MFFSPSSHNRINRLPLPIGPGLTLAFYGGSELDWSGISGISCSTRRVALFFILGGRHSKGLVWSIPRFQGFFDSWIAYRPAIGKVFCCFSTPETREDTWKNVKIREDIAVPRPEVSTEASVKVGMSVDASGSPEVWAMQQSIKGHVRSMSVEWMSLHPTSCSHGVCAIVRPVQPAICWGQVRSALFKHMRIRGKWRPLHEGQKRRTFQINWISAGCWWLLALLFEICLDFNAHSNSLAQFTGRWRCGTDFWGEDRWSKYRVRWT